MEPVERVRIGESGIEGLGVLATVEFLPGGQILSIDDSRVVDLDHPIASEEERHCDYLAGGMVVLMQVPERHINHSCDPNSFLRTEDGVRQVVALRAIRPGEEVTYDYCINGSGDTVWECHCGAARCRHRIHSDFFRLPLALQKEYLPLLDGWYLRERAAEVTHLEKG